MNISKRDFLEVSKGNQEVISKIMQKFGFQEPTQKKCEYCGNLFTAKGNYHSNYCDSIPYGEKHTCKRLAAMKKRKEKIASDPELKSREREYKKLYARMTSGKITREEFEQLKHSCK